MDLQTNNPDQSYISKIAGNKWAIAGLVILIVVIILGAYTLKHKEPTKQYVQTGQVVAGFPKELIFDATDVTQSYQIKYNSKLNQYTVQYESSEPYNVVLARTISYFKDNGYYISNRFVDANSAVAYGIKDDKHISMIATPIETSAPKGKTIKTSTVSISFAVGVGAK
jgi:hypothetical protein